MWGYFCFCKMPSHSLFCWVPVTNQWAQKGWDWQYHITFANEEVEPWHLSGLWKVTQLQSGSGVVANTNHSSKMWCPLHSAVLRLEVKGIWHLYANNLLHSSLQRHPSWATMAACTWRSSCPWSCILRQRMCPFASCPSELMGCWWLLPPGTPPTPCVWSWMGDASSSWLT